MAGRYQTPEDTRITPLQPAAAMVNNFAHPALPPAVVGESKLAQLASALQGIQPSITNFMYHEQARQDTSAADAARTMRAKTMLNYKDAVKQGLPLDKNPFFQKAWKEQDGSVAADKYMADLTTALAVGPFTGSKDQLESDKLFATFRSNWMQEQGVNSEDPAYVEAFNRKANAYDTNARGHQATEIGQRQIADTVNNTYHEAIGAFDDAEQRQLAPSVLAESLNHIADKLVAVGMDPKKVNSVLIDAAVTKSLETKSLNPFLALDSVKTGSGFLGRTNEARVKRDQIENQINSDLEHADSLAWRKREQERTIVEQQTASDIYGYISNQRKSGAPIREEDVSAQIAKLGSLDFHSAESMREVIKLANTAPKWVDDRTTVERLEALDLDHALTIPDIHHAFLDKKLTDDTARLYSDRVEKRQKESEESWRTRLKDKKLTDVSEDPTFQEMFSGIKRVFGETLGVSLGPDKSAALNKALMFAKTAAQDYRDKNLNTSIIDDVKKADEIYRHSVFGTNKDLAGQPVDVRTLTKDQIIPNDAVGKPSSYETLTGPMGNLGTVDRAAKSTLDWQEMKAEYLSELKKTDGTPETTSLGQFFVKHGIAAPDVADAISAQNALYSENAPRDNAPAAAPVPSTTTTDKTPLLQPGEPKVLSEEIITKVMGLNKGVSRDVVVQALKNSGYK